MSHGKQFTLYTHAGGPNGWKVVNVLEELGLTYEPIYLDFGKNEQKAPEYTKYNPNGRIPTIIDHKNGDFVLWESDAILLYLTDKYDTEKRLTVTDEKEKYSLIQWLFFQSSGQGPYFGQAAWFLRYHPEQVPSATERYRKETLRVISVLESVLSKQEWLVGGKPTIADFSFITWTNVALGFTLKDYADVEKDYPAFFAWHQKLVSRDSVKKALATQAALNQ
ncbi:glutathione S-transferase C-terminal-like protein [Dichomitus squalens]|uniref:glutathione transferase n=1 Tax=Dichomitus squalens TaxID=114155 RepID=A0A4Q9NV95_9APHY|nr:glutathione S-transferase C-terminal-like protein [Dichomitus squalens]TBU44667.1 glutathione S-transferase C-terminal-like protein [Dichomitus squalens]TBU59543.1 glutathione S-transferase C-terminal-like protein [Dichomitus squalens]